jgi:hypothetical protein
MRTRLRGLEIAGIQMGIEVPETYVWQWPASPVAEFVCLPRGPEVHIGLRVAEFSSADLGGESYRLGAWTFEVVSCGDDWLLGLSRRGVRELLARFDRDFRNGEILVSKGMAGQGCFPLRRPLDAWIVLNRTVAGGGLVLDGRVGAENALARIRLGADVSGRPSHHRWTTHGMESLSRNTVVLREEGGRLRNFSTPWSDVTEPLFGHSVPVADVTIAEEAERPYRECLDPDEAAELLVAHAVVPLCDEKLFDRVLYNARKIAEQLKVVRVGEVADYASSIEAQSTQLQPAFGPVSAGF